MDTTVVGRERVAEQAILEELSGPAKPVRGTDRRWMLAIAGIAAIVCMGFAGDLVSPTPAGPVVVPERGAPASTAPSAAASAPVPAIDAEVSRPDGTVIDGLVPVRVRAVPGHRVHLSVSVGTAVVGWRDVKLNARGEWAGTVRVFAPRATLSATLHAATTDGPIAVEDVHPFVLGRAPRILVWEASVSALNVTYRASAPLTFTRVDAWVTDSRGRRVGGSRTASRVDEWQAGSAGAGELGIGSVVDVISVRRHGKGRLMLTIAWHDASTASSGTLVVPLDPAGPAPAD